MSERIGALRYIIRLFREVWKTSPILTCAAFGLRLIKALQPVLTFYIGKLIVDEIVSLTRSTGAGYAINDWLMSGKLNKVSEYVGLELAMTIGFDVVQRLISLCDPFLAEEHNNRTSLALMAHAASLDLQHLESSDHQDQLERARGQAVWSSNFLSQIFGQRESLMALATLAAGLFAYAPLLILLLIAGLIPSLWNEAYFNVVAHKLNFDRAEERRRLDYLRYIGINAETAKEIKLFDLSDFLIRRFDRLASGFYAANKKLAIRRAFWSGFFSRSAPRPIISPMPPSCGGPFPAYFRSAI